MLSGGGRLDRILSYKETDEDEKVAAQAAIHYNDWHEEALSKALDWPSWLKFHTLVRAERTATVLGIAGTGFAGYRAALASFRYLRAASTIRKVGASSHAMTDVSAVPASPGSPPLK